MTVRLKLSTMIRHTGSLVSDVIVVQPGLVHHKTICENRVHQNKVGMIC